MMKKRFFEMICVTAIILTNILSVAAQSETEDVIKVETTLISVPVIVSDRQNRYVGGLKVNDFKIFQDGVEQKIEFFAATEEPFNVAVLIDTSRSTAEVLDEIKAAAKSFVERLQSTDKAMIVSFDSAPHILQPLTSNRKDLKRAIENAEIGEQFGTALHDALDQVINESFAAVKGRKAVILLTDGKDFGSATTAADLTYSLEESETLIYSIFYKTGFPARNAGNRRRGIFRRERGGIFGGRNPNSRRGEKANQAATDFLQEISDLTAGRFYQSEVTDLTKTFDLITDELRHQYRLGFYPPNVNQNNELHTLQVRLSRPNLSVRTRQSYRAVNKTSMP